MLVKINKKWRRSEKLTFKDYKRLLPKGNAKHYQELTGKTIEPKKALKEEKPLQKEVKKEEKTVKVTKEDKGNLETK